MVMEIIADEDATLLEKNASVVVVGRDQSSRDGMMLICGGQGVCSGASAIVCTKRDSSRRRRESFVALWLN